MKIKKQEAIVMGDRGFVSNYQAGLDAGVDSRFNQKDLRRLGEDLVSKEETLKRLSKNLKRKRKNKEFDNLYAECERVFEEMMSLVNSGRQNGDFLTMAGDQSDLLKLLDFYL